MKGLWVGIVVLGAATSVRADPPAASRPDLLRQLDGHWTMTGDVMGKPVTYDLEGGATLSEAFTELHMKDVQVPAEYEARVFLGWDAEAQSVIVHWLDSFGGKYSIPHGLGRIDGNRIVFTIPYAEGPFRDTLTYDATARQWRFLIEAGQKDGSWKDFAHYEIRRK